MKKYAEGGGEFDFEVPMPRKGGYGGPQDEGDDAPKKQSFKDAFAEARKGGGKTFEWQGKKYTTEMAKPKAKADSAGALTKQRKATIDRETLGDEVAMKTAPRRAPSKFEPSSVDENTLLPKKYAKGGSVSGRADGIASKGKTNCKMV